MRLITSVGLAMLLVLGIAASAHSEPEGSTAVPHVMAGLVDPHVDAMTPPAEHDAVLDGSSESSLFVGAALCVFGVLCGLTLLALLRGWWRRVEPPELGMTPRMIAPLLSAAARPHTVALSLAQLSLSRT